jgi:hypothetical protein
VQSKQRPREDRALQNRVLEALGELYVEKKFLQTKKSRR